MNPKQKLEQAFLTAIKEFEEETKSNVTIIFFSYVLDNIRFINHNGESRKNNPSTSLKIEL